MSSPYADILYANGDIITLGGATFTAQNASQPYSMRRENNNFRSELHLGDQAPIDVGSARSRSEFCGPTLASANVQTWGAASVCVEPGDPIVPGNGIILMQYHLGDAGSGTAPGLCLMATAITGVGEVLGWFDETWSHYATVALVRGHVYKAVGTIVDALGANTGIVQGWLDGTRILNASAIVTGHVGFAPGYWKFGTYITEGGITATSHSLCPEFAVAPNNLNSRI